MPSTEAAPAVAGTIPQPSRMELDYDAPALRQLDRLTNFATVAQIEIDLYDEASREYAALCAREMELEHDRAAAKQNAVLRLLQTVNPASGDAQKPYSATAAESAASLDHEYRAHLRFQSETVLAKHLTYGRMTAHKLRAQLAVARLKAEGGFQ